MSELTVKVFVDNGVGTIAPVATKTEARKLFDRWVGDEACQSVYVYQNGRIIASWDRDTQYLLAIGDIAIDDDGCIDGDPYGTFLLYDMTESEAQP